MKYIYLILTTLFFISCNTGVKRTDSLEHKNKNIDSLLITYFCGNLESSVAIKCEKIAKIQMEHPINDYSLLSEGIVEAIDTFIVDKLIIEEVKPLLKKQQPIQNFNEDTRMYVTVKYTDNTTDNICLGMNTPNVFFNGEPIKIENELVFLLRKYSGYYRWFDKEDLLRFEEYHN